MVNFTKAFAWLVLVAIGGYIIVALAQGPGVTGNVVKETDDGTDLGTCVDRDDGKDYWKKSVTYNEGEDNMQRDHCATSVDLVEYFCNGNFVDRIKVKCTCYDGMCVTKRLME
jgi:hypothetical protein